MAARSKAVGTFREAVADIPDGSIIAFGGFAMPGTPFNLIKALLEQGAKRLTLVGNTTGDAQQPRMPDMGMLVENGRRQGDLRVWSAPPRGPPIRCRSLNITSRGECDAEPRPTRHSGGTAGAPRGPHSRVLHAHRRRVLNSPPAERPVCLTAANICWNTRCRSITRSFARAAPTPSAIFNSTERNATSIPSWRPPRAARSSRSTVALAGAGDTTPTRCIARGCSCIAWCCARRAYGGVVLSRRDIRHHGGHASEEINR